ncbi:hypothetical protein BCR43DRAFT_559182 [Syncephalastrum racemosum]|uniref:Uncharacterized protein n=1 Tax=Syncephalastrum racemosum TaxID=13706 RepID=A0A1X2HRJ6_SYNRA|nr:hypothetical protein BCR43DRAFT_559182 [Syncephalastrum racemosum]
MTPDTPVNAGHAYANAAEDYEDREEWQEAAEAHAKAAAAEPLEDMEGLRHALAESRTSRRNYYYPGTQSPAIGGSYAVLPDDGRDDDDEDEADPFNKFWQVVEQLVDKLSNPVAFASAPLNEHDDPTAHEDGDEDGTNTGMLNSYCFVQLDTAEADQSTLLSKARNHATENEILKKQVEQLTNRIRSLEKAAEESNMLKSSIIQFRNDVQKQAKRIMQGHDHVMRASSSAALMGPHHSSYLRPSSANPSYELARIKELEEENRQLRIQNEKQQALMNKYRERWEKLKESAKKRRATDQQQHHQNDHSSSNNRSYPAPGLSTCSSEYSGRTQPTLLRSLAQQASNASSASFLPFATSSASKSQSSPEEKRKP